ncbi:hypothetical protein FKM82_010158 [Ascaphus truei]
MLLEVVLALVIGALLYQFFFKRKDETLPVGDGWWGPGTRTDKEEEEDIRPFKIETTEEELNDLFRRLDQTRFSEPLEGSRFNYGFNSTHLRKVVSYWRSGFNWRKQLDILNQYPHYKTKIEGIDIHFVHVKPVNLPAGRTAKPIIMVHGWPGSFYEFYKMIPLLTDPASHGLSDEHVFEVICPSIPGYGFSEASHKQGCNSVAVARVFYKLMLRLGFREFYAQGGDWGSLVCTNLAQIAPSHVKGLHLNMVMASAASLPQLMSILLGQRFPGLFGFQDEDVRRMFPFLKKVFYHIVKESGYMHIQATKPDTAVKVPTGIASFPNELVHCPLFWAKKKYVNIVSFNYMPRGGHFGAFEEPEMLAKDILQFVGKLEQK